MIDSMKDSLRGVGKRDIGIAALMTALGITLMVLNVQGDGEDPSKAAIHYGGVLPYWTTIVLFPLVTVPLVWRRVHPIGAMQFALGGLILNELLVGTDVVRCGVLFPTAFLFAFAAGSQLEGTESRKGLALSLALVLVDVLELGPVAPVIMGPVAAAMWWIGRVVRSRKRMSDELEVRTAELRQARDERARLEVSSDRARLSGELDELLQRRLGELALMADEGSRPTDPEEAAATLAEIERESRRTLDEMRAVVGVLREDTADAPTTPQPTLTHLQALLTRAKGGDARLKVEGNPRVLPPAVELSAFRIVEQLLAALEDAPDVEVLVRFGDDSLELAVSGPARRRAKAAIERARERARLQQGTLDATVRGGRAEAEVSLPVLAAV
jgi:signal transduction histidine kinase